jgi:hypothetical protein
MHKSGRWQDSFLDLWCLGMKLEGMGRKILEGGRLSYRVTLHLELFAMKRTYIVNDIFWIAIAMFVCWEGYNLGFGTFRQPQTGFMPFLSGLVLGVLGVVDLISGLISRFRAEKEDKEIWAEIAWGKISLMLALLLGYTAFFSTLGFVIVTMLLLLFLFRMMSSRPLWFAIIISSVTTALFYLVFKVGLDSQLPGGIMGF